MTDPPGKNLGGRPGITLDDVRLACERLMHQERRVGPVNVRLEIGTGSYSTIQRHLRTLGYAESSKKGNDRKDS